MSNREKTFTLDPLMLLDLSANYLTAGLCAPLSTTSLKKPRQAEIYRGETRCREREILRYDAERKERYGNFK